MSLDQQLLFDISPITSLDPKDNNSAEPVGEIPKRDLLCFIDGSCKPNPGMMAVGVYIEYHCIPLVRRTYPGGNGTNNEAEFCAAIQMLKTLKAIKESDHPAKNASVAVMSDSTMLVGAITGKVTVKVPKLKLRLLEINELLKTIGPIEFVWIPRAKNTAAHVLSADELVL